MAASLLIAGTTSDAGKSLVTAALCRAFVRRGISVAPFKAQNMSNNSMVVGEVAGPGGEIGRAQWVQALAAEVQPETSMNPVLLKPGSDQRSHVVVNGQPAGTISSDEFIGGRTHLAETAFAAFDDLASRFDLVVCEGAGSPAEINLRAGDYTNMGLARHADIPVVVVGDIDRGGVFASLFGTVALLDADDQRLVSGFIINKFRGNQALLQPGVDRLRALTGRSTYGVLPWSPDVWLDSEDALDLSSRAEETVTERPLTVGVVRFPRVSNFTDIDALSLEPGVEVSWITDPGSVAGVDLVVLPGTRSTLADLSWLRFRGLDRAIVAHASAGRPVLGICGGFQMLGHTIHDPDGVEGARAVDVDGLGLLDATTTFSAEKVLRAHANGAFEIHHGRVEVGDADPASSSGGGWTSSGAVMGTMRHGALESDSARTMLLGLVAAAVGHHWQPSEVNFSAARDRRLDLLGDLAEEHLDLDALLALARDGAPEVPLLAPGAGA